MADYPYCTVPGKLSELLRKVHDLGIPDKVTTRWLPTIGFASANDRSIIPVLKFVGLINSSGAPTEIWKEYRGHASGRALAAAIEQAYGELFKTYPDAHSRGAEELKAFFRGHSSYGAQAVSKAVNTFQALCQNADFTGHGAAKRSTPHEVPEVYSEPDRTSQPKQTTTSNASLHIDLQIHISPEATPEQIDKIFESMAKHLYRDS